MTIITSKCFDFNYTFLLKIKQITFCFYPGEYSIKICLSFVPQFIKIRYSVGVSYKSLLNLLALRYLFLN